MIRLHRVCKLFQGGPMKLPALNDVSFTVEKGEFVVLSGASGAGKTTLLRLLYADEQASDGDIEVAGFDVTNLRRSEIPLLLADEPTGNLDEEMAGEILDLIKDIWSRGTTVLVATHQSRLAAQLKRRTLRLDAGVLTKDEG